MCFFDANGREDPYLYFSFSFIEIWTKEYKEYKEGLQGQNSKKVLKPTLTLHFQGFSNPLLGLDANQAMFFFQKNFSSDKRGWLLCYQR
jgi:hypothetical protein